MVGMGSSRREKWNIENQENIQMEGGKRLRQVWNRGTPSPCLVHSRSAAALGVETDARTGKVQSKGGPGGKRCEWLVRRPRPSGCLREGLSNTLARVLVQTKTRLFLPFPSSKVPIQSGDADKSHRTKKFEGLSTFSLVSRPVLHQ